MRKTCREVPELDLSRVVQLVKSVQRSVPASYLVVENRIQH